jgi:hypothetical protein
MRSSGDLRLDGGEERVRGLDRGGRHEHPVADRQEAFPDPDGPLHVGHGLEGDPQVTLFGVHLNRDDLGEEREAHGRLEGLEVVAPGRGLALGDLPDPLRQGMGRALSAVGVELVPHLAEVGGGDAPTALEDSDHFKLRGGRGRDQSSLRHGSSPFERCGLPGAVAFRAKGVVSNAGIIIAYIV